MTGVQTCALPISPLPSKTFGLIESLFAAFPVCPVGATCTFSIVFGKVHFVFHIVEIQLSLQQRMSPVGKCEKSVFWGMGSFHGLTGGTNLHRYKSGFNVTIVYPVRTAASHVAKRGSNPLGDASECKSHITMMWLFCVPAYEPREAKRAVFPA